MASKRIIEGCVVLERKQDGRFIVQPFSKSSSRAGAQLSSLCSSPQSIQDVEWRDEQGHALHWIVLPWKHNQLTAIKLLVVRSVDASSFNFSQIFIRQSLVLKYNEQTGRFYEPVKDGPLGSVMSSVPPHA
jgi:hypothetical protein